MLLLTVSEWIGPGRKHPGPESVAARTRTVAFATYLSLEEAIGILSAYEDRYNTHYALAVNFSLLSVSKVEEISTGALECMRVELIESLPKKKFE